MRPRHIKHALKEEPAAPSEDFFAYAARVMDDFRRQGKIRSFQRYQSAYNKFKRFTSAPLPFEEITPQLLRSFQTHLIEERGNKQSTIAVNLRVIRAGRSAGAPLAALSTHRGGMGALKVASTLEDFREALEGLEGLEGREVEDKAHELSEPCITGLSRHELNTAARQMEKQGAAHCRDDSLRRRRYPQRVPEGVYDDAADGPHVPEGARSRRTLRAHRSPGGGRAPATGSEAKRNVPLQLKQRGKAMSLRRRLDKLEEDGGGGAPVVPLEMVFGDTVSIGRQELTLEEYERYKETHAEGREAAAHAGQLVVMEVIPPEEGQIP